ncbi:hypothetical protein EV680_10367 [Uruburuella suis]|uniref:Uncharacterized protein n=1 Tax=Uruburuella suis TaxID=252130 RepID=A0ABY2C202_9NEIS|nr:hypothetical protein EV680_10367 [Uruburuella suis]
MKIRYTDYESERDLNIHFMCIIALVNFGMFEFIRLFLILYFNS